jgi:hypothetical protein
MDNRIHKNKVDYGMPDYYKFYKNRIGSIEKVLFNSIITDFNNGITNLIIEKSLTFYMPYLGFEILIKKDRRKPKIVDGKLINNVPIDWKATNELWNKDQEARDKKLLVRYNNSHTSGYVFRIYCKKFKGNIKNKNLFKFKPNRKFQRSLSARIKDPDKDNFDAFLLYKNQ